MRLLYLTAGTGSFYCGTCLRDATLVKALRALGHDALLAPLYLPLVLEEEVPSEKVHLGGINAFLAHRRLALPRIVQEWLDSPRLLRWTAGKRDMTGARSLGELTHAMLLGEDGTQAREIEKLLGWLATRGGVDAVLLSNGLLVGLARPLARALRVPILCSLQGEVPYLDALVEPEYLAIDTPGWEGTLKHGVYHTAKNLGVDESVMWGEYFFVEALLKAEGGGKNADGKRQTAEGADSSA